MSNEATIKDIARELNISPSTVSRALKDHPDINSETKKAVLRVAQKLDYQPNSIALSLRKSKTNIIGVIIPELVHYFFSTVISGIEDVANEAGYHVMICQSNESYDKEVANTQALLSTRVDGLLMSISSETENFDHLRSLQRRNVPIVFFDRASAEIEASKIEVDDYDGAFRATQHLIETGCKRILHLAGPEHLSVSVNRAHGYKAALKANNIEYDPTLMVTTGFKQQDGTDIMTKLLDEGLKFDGIFAVADPVAIGAMLVLKKRNIKIPDDVSVIGFSDEPMTSLIEPALSTMSQPGYEMGVRAARLFLEQVKDKDNFVPKKEILKTQLIIRESSRKK
ncbi:LacI family DNA-binding transcriptional regulator [Cytophagales bacterium LB-30]|uniref:LacI family DNA-binding transcriptional regulator n=1 Tax=Shiella aurantiaca TaxID=3058365 RepID=A0ABT8F0X8_9BACT|nr:LacI family DNA-binding transcriptional regulator [Shiella aurantiaca]MDN4164095.1 LacI family DNA-binding transcriptional regulator [Shiella aurantiaca]